MSYVPLNNLLAMRAAILVQHLEDMEVISNELMSLRDTLANINYDAGAERSRILHNMEDRKVTLTCMKNTAKVFRQRVKDILAQMEEEYPKEQGKFREAATAQPSVSLFFPITSSTFLNNDYYSE